MSSAVVSTSAALGRPFLFEAEPEPEVPTSGKMPSGNSPITQGFHSAINNHQSTISLGNRHSALENAVLPASRLGIRPAPEMATSGIPALDVLTGGLPRGCLTEIYGPASSGRTSVMLAALAAATRRGEYCALIDASDALDPHSLAAAGIDLDRLLWVRCNSSPQRHGGTEKTNQGKEFIANKSLGQRTFEVGRFGKRTAFDIERHRLNDSQERKQSECRLEQVLRATDLLLESGGFGLILLDLADIPHQSARRIPMTTWFRFRRAVEHKPTILLAVEQQPIAGSCSSLQLQLGSPVRATESKPEKWKSAPKSAPSNSSREAAELVSPGRKPWGAKKDSPESRWDVTLSFDSSPTPDRGTTPLIPPSHARLFTELEINAELIRSRLDRKPARPVAFETKTAWAG